MTSVRDKGIGARVLRLDGLPPALFLFRSLPTPASKGYHPEKFKEPATRMMGSPVPLRADPDA